MLLRSLASPCDCCILSQGIDAVGQQPQADLLSHLEVLGAAQACQAQATVTCCASLAQLVAGSGLQCMEGISCENEGCQACHGTHPYAAFGGSVS